MHAKVDENSCISCGLCASECPEVFEMSTGDSTVAKVIADPVPPGAIEQCRVAANSCPVEAIKLSE